MISRFTNVYNRFPRTFWTLVSATFIDRLGGFLIFPYLSLYVTWKFNVGMTQVGTLFAIFSISSMFGSTLGGAMTDKFGRRAMLIFGLVVSALSSLAMGIVNDINLFYSTAVVVGLLANAGGPAQQAMVADILPEKKQTEGYGILRVVVNLAAVIGPAIGGLLATTSYLLLFIFDAVASVITAGIVFKFIPETKPKAQDDQPPQSLIETLLGYRFVLRDGIFMAFMVISIFTIIVYMQMNSTLSVYLRDYQNIPPQGFGYLLSFNAAMVVLFQFWITRRVKKRPPLLIMALGAILFAIGFSMYGLVTSYILFILAMGIITVGEMVIMPVSQALVASLSPADMRGRYMAVFGFSWGIPAAVGPLLAGIIMDNYNPDWVWYLCGIIGSMAAIGFVLLHQKAGESLKTPEIQMEPVQEM